MRILRKLLLPDLYEEMIAHITQQRDMLAERREQLLQLELAHSRLTCDMLANFLVILDQPDNEDARHALIHAFEDMADQVARLEEHV